MFHIISGQGFQLLKVLHADQKRRITGGYSLEGMIRMHLFYSFVHGPIDKKNRYRFMHVVNLTTPCEEKQIMEGHEQMLATTQKELIPIQSIFFGALRHSNTKKERTRGLCPFSSCFKRT